MSQKKYKTKVCPICEKEHNNRGITCSRTCADVKRKEYSKNIDLICVLCGDIFHSKDGTGKYCSKIHYKKCEVCGKDFPIPKGKEAKNNPTCGPSCGASYSHRSKNNKEIRKQNSLKKWGVENPFQAEEVKEKIKIKLEGTAGRFGTEASKETLRKIYGVENVSKLDFVKEKKAATYKENYTDKGIYPNRGPVSKTNLRWKEKLEEATGLSWELEKHFNSVGNIDLYAENGNIKVAVEINPTATHNSYKNLVSCFINECNKFPCENHTLDKNYHFNKVTKLKELYNVPLISIFDWMDEDKTISFIKSKLHCDKNKIYGKQTKIITLTQTEANKFFNSFHMLGASRKQTYCYGLVYEGLVVQVQSFAPMGKEEGVYEAKRLATRDDWVVVGGVSKLTQHFIKEVKPKKIVAFSDLNLGYPDFDVKYNNFTRSEVLKPQKCWSKGARMILNKSAAWQSADRLIGIAKNSKESIYPEEWSNEQVFLAEKWLPVWDCGMLKDVWDPNSYKLI